MRFSICLALMMWTTPLIAPPHAGAAGPATAGDFLGRWDITIPADGKSRARYCWLETTMEGGLLKGRFNQGGGAVFALPEIAVENDELKFQHPIGRPDDRLTAVYRARLMDDKLDGTATFGKEAPRKLIGVRGPKWQAKKTRRRRKASR